MTFEPPEKSPRRLTFGACLVMALIGATFASGQSRVLVEHEDDMLPVLAMDGEYPIVVDAGERRRVYDGRVSVVPADFFTDGAVHVLAKDAVMGQRYGAGHSAFVFGFSAEVKAERDFEDCFILFAITPSEGEDTYAMREIADIDAMGNQQIQVEMEVNPSFGGGQFAYKIFSAGEEIEVIDPEVDLKVRSEEGGDDAEAESARRRSSGEASIPTSPARVVEVQLPEFPAALSGVAQAGYAVAVYTIDRNGRVMELLDLKADHPALLPEAQKAIVNSRYQPGFYDGRPLVTTVQQSFFFHESASFPEELVMISYPSLPDRAAQAIYHPLPEQTADARGEVKVEILVDRLGRPSSVRILGSPDDKLADATLESVQRWVFLPAVEDGYPVEQTITVPIVFKRR